MQNAIIDTTTGATDGAAFPRIQTARDQRAEWADMRSVNRDALQWSEACEVVAGAATADGRRVDATMHLAHARTVDVGGMLAIQRGDRAPVVFRDHAFGQLASLLAGRGVAHYLRSLPATLARECLDHGLQHSTREVMLRGVVREDGCEARAIVSPRYSEIDDGTLLPIVSDALTALGLTNAVQVRAVAVGSRTVLRCTVGTMAMADGHPVAYGFDISNGELGNASLSIVASVYRLVCTNGMRSWTTHSKTTWRHVGEPARLRDKARETIPVVIEHARTVGEACGRAHDRVVPAAEMPRLLAALDLTKAQTAEATRQARIEAGHIGAADNTEAGDERPVTLWHLINGVTASARALDHTGRLHVEEQAPALLRHVA